LTFLITYKGTSEASRFDKDSIKHVLLISVPKFEVFGGKYFQVRHLPTCRSPPRKKKFELLTPLKTLSAALCNMAKTHLLKCLQSSSLLSHWYKGAIDLTLNKSLQHLLNDLNSQKVSLLISLGGPRYREKSKVLGVNVYRTRTWNISTGVPDVQTHKNGCSEFPYAKRQLYDLETIFSKDNWIIDRALLFSALSSKIYFLCQIKKSLYSTLQKLLVKCAWLSSKNPEVLNCPEFTRFVIQ